MKLLRTLATALLASAAPTVHSTQSISFAHFHSANPEIRVSPGGETAKLTESGAVSRLRLVNDPHLNDPAIIDPALIDPGTHFLVFAYQFDEHATGNDELLVVLFDADQDPYTGTLETLSIRTTDAGTAAFDLAPWADVALGLAFELIEHTPAGGTLGTEVTLAQLRQTNTVLDTDGDGIPDDYETSYGLNPQVDDAALDADGDELSHYLEYLNGTDPNNRDTDGDSMPDGEELEHGLNPLDASDCPEWFCFSSSILLRGILVPQSD